VRISREKLVSLLERLAASVRADDSLEGSLRYRAEGDGRFEVGCCYRVGNSAGQGGVVLVEPEDPVAPAREVVEGEVVESAEPCDCWEGVNDREGLGPCAHERLPAGGHAFHNSREPGRCRCGADGPPWRHLSTCRYD
jgi:hypothetical protein